MIDVHTHIGYHELFPDYFVKEIANSLFKTLPLSEQNASGLHLLERLIKASLSDKDGSQLVKQATLGGIEKSVVLIVDFFYQEGGDQKLTEIERVHEFHKKILENNGDKIVVFSGIDPRRGQDGLDLLEKALKEYGFKGLKLYPPCGFEIDEAVALDYYQLCSEIQVPVLIHTGPSVDSMYVSTRYPSSVENIARQFPKLNLILAHAGILYFDEGFYLAKKYSNIYVDISGFQKDLGKKDAIGKKVGQYMSCVPNKIIFGSDWPLFNVGKNLKDTMLQLKGSLDLKQSEWERLFEGNAREALGIEKENIARL